MNKSNLESQDIEELSTVYENEYSNRLKKLLIMAISDIILLVVLIVMACNSAMADDFKTYYDNAQNFLNSSQYTNAITEFKKALRINYMDNSARIGLINSYLARGAYYANTNNDYEKAANDFRSALFYLKIYPEDKDVAISAGAIQTTTDNLENCIQALNQSKAPQERYNRAVFLRKSGDLPAAAYEFISAAQSNDKNIQKNAFLHVGDIMAVLNNSSKAAFYYQKSVALDPDNATLRLKYARTLDKLGKENLAVKEYNEILARGSENAEVLQALEKIYIKKLVSEPNSAELNSNLGAILQKQKKYDAALTYYKTAESLDSGNITTRLNIGTLYQQMKDYNNALSAYNSVIALYPNNFEANLYRAKVLAELGEDKEAIKAFQKTLSIDPTSVVAKRELFTVLKKTMTPTEMINYLSNDAAVDKSTITALYEYAKELHTQNKLDDAIACYNEVLKHESNNPEIYANLAIAYVNNKDYANAQKIVNGVKNRFATDKSIKDATELVYQTVNNKKYEDANRYFSNSEYQNALNIYLTIYPAPKDVLIAIAACYKGLDKIDKAIEYYKKAYNMDKKDSEIAYYLGVLYAEKEAWSSAKIYLQESIKLDPKNNNAKDLLSTVVEQNNLNLINKVISYYNEKNYEQALKLISQILTEDSNNAYAYYYRGLIYDAQEKPLQAIPEYKKAVQHNPELIISDYLIATAYDSLGQYSNAYNYYKKFVNISKTNDDYKKYAQTRLADLKNFAN